MIEETQEQKIIYDQVNPPKPLNVRFYNQPVVKEVINGVKVYKPRLMAQVQVKGENSSLSKIATDELKFKYSDEYERFKSRQFNGLTPLCALTDEMTAQSLIDMGIKSVDDLAQSNTLPLFDHLRDQAKKLLEIKNAPQNRCEHHNHKEEVHRAIEESNSGQGHQEGHDQDRRQYLGPREERNPGGSQAGGFGTRSGAEERSQKNNQKESNQEENNQKETQEILNFDYQLSAWSL